MNMLALCSLTPCLGKALQSLMSFDMGCEIYAIQMSHEKWSNFVGLMCVRSVFPCQI